MRRQTLANAERYVTPEVQELEERILHAEDRRLAIERRLYADLVVDTKLADKIFQRVEAELHMATEIVLNITGRERLLDDFPVLQASIERRNP